ncbi:hypothetical protein ACP70R_029683 [Stipagrostis hirtigluma subsp. patula]
MAFKVTNLVALALILALLFVSCGMTEADAGEFSPPMARRRLRASPVPSPPTANKPPVTPADPVPEANCPLIQVPGLVDACRRPPGLSGCAAQCVVYHYRGGHCDVLPDGRVGDCACMNCLGRHV